MSTRCPCLGHCLDLGQNHDCLVRSCPFSVRICPCRVRTPEGLESPLGVFPVYRRSIVRSVNYSLEDLETQLEPVRWAESYEMYGERKPNVDDRCDLSRYRYYSKFKARCKICGEFTKEARDSNDARFWHFLHCSKVHGHVFPEDYTAAFKVSDPKLQEMIMTSMLYDLYLPSMYADHDDCVRKYCKGKVVCVIHSGNEYGSGGWIDL
jgi:hypothetical protein